jgi:hypothetical protein
MSVVDTWAEQAAEMDTVDELADLWMAGARELGLVDSDNESVTGEGFPGDQHIEGDDDYNPEARGGSHE